MPGFMNTGARGSFALLVLSATACAYRTPPVELPDAMGGIDPQAIEVESVTVVAGGGRAVNADLVEDVTEFVERALLDARNERDEATDPATAIVEVTLQGYQDLLPVREMSTAMIFLVASILGAKIESAKVRVDITLRHDGSTLRGIGTAEMEGSLYAPARKRAVAVATQRALDQAFADP